MASIKKYVTESGKQRWEFYVYAGIKPNGKPRQIHRRGFLTSREAKRNAGRIESELLDTEYEAHEPSQMPISEYMHKWLNELKVDAKRGTKLTYRENIEQYIIPNIGNIKLKDYSREKHGKFINSLFTHDGYGRSGHGLSWNTVQSIQGTMSSAMHIALQNGYIKVNPTLDPQYNRSYVPRHIHKLRRTYSSAEASQFLDYAADEKDPIWLAFFTTAFDAGVRKGENAGLHWGDIDFIKNTIHVHGQRLLKAEQSGQASDRPDGIIIDTTKTPAGERYIPMTKRLAATLKAYYEEFYSEDLTQIVGNKGHIHNRDLIYIYQQGKSVGKTIRGDSINRAFTRIAKRAGLPQITVHDIRHSYAVRSRTAGVSLDDIQDLLGHSDPSTTRIYATVTPEIKQNAVSKLDELDAEIVKSNPNDYQNDYQSKFK
ncbi:tyrosine-type recombinase/integrase (plasmid) [Furfurilactobacillus rossiae]|uniref:tyrosine-type recombinase/integrase n=1 Tax=Furfurilactobacillus rossiae TaxID=231049 RepID=UPI001F29CF53|nr:tyrosine-type recombinase/integrase [Furfurilactobacillus rossiae]MCF6164811.1 site-specific integrase [Furfurilactobacillus rossiae]